MDELDRQYLRWRLAEHSGNAEDADTADAADAAFGSVFGAAMPEVHVPASFAGETMHVIAAVAAQDARRARRTRAAVAAGSVALGAVALYLGAGPALSLLSTFFVGVLDFLVATVVWFASGSGARPDLWSVLTSIGRAIGAFVADPKVTVVLLALQGLAIAAFVALQRLLGSDAEFYR